jgi:hypothetical protein
MDIQILNNGQPQQKKWLNPTVYDIKCYSMETQTTITTEDIETNNLSADIILLNHDAVVGVPPVGFSLLYADNADRLLVASQTSPTETVAYLSDIPMPPPVSNSDIVSADLSAKVECLNGGIINGIINGGNVLTCNNIKSRLENGLSRVQLAAVSDLLTDNTSTYFATQNAALTKNMAVAIAPDQLYINQDYGAVNRLVVDDAKTGLYSKNVTSGPAGSLLELNNDNTFTLGAYFANNGIIECRPNSLALYGNAATSAITMTGSDITTSLGLAGRIDREILDTTSQKFKDANSIERLRVDNLGVTISNTYTLTNSGGIGGQVLTTDGFGGTSWQTPTPPQVYGLYSQIATQTVANTTTETTLISPIGVGSLTVPPLYFQNGYSFLYKTGGLFRDSSTGQTIRFRLRNSGVLFDSGILTLSNVNTNRGWNIEAQFTYYGGNIITNFQFSYTSGTNDSFGFNNQGTNAINNAVANTLDFTVQWGSASVQNTITSNYGTLTKIF